MNNNIKTRMTGAIVVGIVLVIGTILLFMSMTIIPQGHVGLVWSQTDGVQDNILGEGLTFVAPLHRVTAMPISTETVSVNYFNVITRDGKTLGIQMSYDYSVQADMVTNIFTMFRGQSMDVIEQGWLEDRVQRASLNVFGRYSVMDVFQNLARIQGDVFEEVVSIVEKYGFTISAVTIQAPILDSDTQAMVQQLVNAQLESERMQIELTQASIEADTLIEEARGVAESTLILATAEAEANQLLQRSLTEELIAAQWIEAWDGRLPVVSSGEGGNHIIDISSIIGGD